MSKDEQIQNVAFVDIEIVPLLRKSIDDEKLAGMMQSIQEVGLLYPPRLTREGEKYVPADGFHRILCCMKLGWKTIPAIIEAKQLSEGEKLQKGMIANAHHSDLTPLEKSEGIARLQELTGWNGTKVAEKLGFSNATVSRLLSLRQLPESIREKVNRGEIPLSAASKLATVEDEETQAALATDVASGTLTRDGLTGAIRSQRNAKSNAQSGTSRVCCKLPTGSSVTVAGDSLDLEDFITALEEVLAKARKARTQGIEVATLAKMFRDMAKAG